MKTCKRSSLVALFAFHFRGISEKKVDSSVVRWRGSHEVDLILKSCVIENRP